MGLLHRQHLTLSGCKNQGLALCYVTFDSRSNESAQFASVLMLEHPTR